MSAVRPAGHRRALDVAIVTLFLCALAAPSVDGVLRKDARRDARAELRVPAPMPGRPATLAELTAWPGRYATHFDDTFGLRDVLLREHSLARYRLGVGVARDLVVGRDGWIFYAGDRSLQVQRGTAPLDAGELAAWRDVLLQRRRFVEARGACWLYAIAPNKESVYPEMLGPAHRPLGPSRLDQLLAYAARSEPGLVLDLRPSLCAEKTALDRPGSHVYNELGSHWNARGAFAAYAAIVRALQRCRPSIVILARDDVKWVVEDEIAQDTWAVHMYASDVVRQEFRRALPREPRSEVATPMIGGRLVRRERPDDPDLPRAVVFHDSFGPFVEALLAESFGEVLFVDGPFDPEIVTDEQPDIVVELFVERTLVTNDPRIAAAQSPLADGARFAAPSERYAASGSVVFRCAPCRTADGFEVDGPGSLLSADPAAPGVHFTTAEPNAGLLLPRLHLEAARRLVLRIELSNRLAGGLELYWCEAGQPGFKRTQRVILARSSGDRTVHVPLALAAGDWTFLMRSRSGPADFVVQSVEARAEGD